MLMSWIFFDEELLLPKEGNELKGLLDDPPSDEPQAANTRIKDVKKNNFPVLSI